VRYLPSGTRRRSSAKFWSMTISCSRWALLAVHSTSANRRGRVVDADLSTLLKVALSLSKGETGASREGQGVA